MLTGESVPVSKIPVKDEGLKTLSRENKKGSTEVDSDLAKHYLFSGTKIIRIRPGGSPAGLGLKGDHAKALAIVTRTGEQSSSGVICCCIALIHPFNRLQHH
jgi:cation-transporting ATPase 13A3/4/5